MRIFLTQITVLFFIFAAFSCTKNKHAGEIRSLDSLYQGIISVEKQLSQIDTLKIQRTYEEIVRNIKFIRQNFHGTYDKSSIELITAYKNTRKPLYNFQFNSVQILHELDYSKKQLEHLVFDLRKGTISDENASIYFSDERIAAKRIHGESKLLADSLNSALQKFQELHPLVQEFINENIIKAS
ncbi:MAG: hypothetical protein H0V01_07370 [Bacteroidetes bacterium]|nr:hypothetical protein [Bacteroidota bacterium]